MTAASHTHTILSSASAAAPLVMKKKKKKMAAQHPKNCEINIKCHKYNKFIRKCTPRLSETAAQTQTHTLEAMWLN